MTSTEQFYQEYPCTHKNPFNCDKPLETVKELEAMQEFKGAKFCYECGFPAILPIEAEIKGNRGSYRVKEYLGVRGFGRLYSGVQTKDQQPVIIKEYLLPTRSFNQDETFQRKETFRSIGGVELADGRVQNFRLIQTWEAIAPEKGERCYLITKDIQPSQTLNEYLKKNVAMTPEQVREFLDEVIQTLVFMHTQKIRFPSNKIQKGLAHGNINLDSVLIKVENQQRFVVYLCDIAIWENLFIPPIIPQITSKTQAQDLESLGLAAFHLWVGKNQLFNLKDYQTWPWPNNDEHLKNYLERLLSIKTPFSSAEEARQALLKLPRPNESRNLQPSFEPEKQKRSWKKYWIGLGLLVFLLLGGALWYFISRRHQDELAENKYLAWRQLKQNFSDVDNVTSGNFSYAGEKNSTWSFVLTHPSNGESRLEDILTQPKPEAKATFIYNKLVSEDINNVSKPIEETKQRKQEFAITSLEDKIKNDLNLNKQPIAYDGLLVFVAASKNSFKLPRDLGGKISLDQLRGIYTGKIQNWNQIDSSLESLPIDPKVPIEPEAIQQFKKLVLNNDQQAIALFNQIAKSPQNTGETQNQMRTELAKNGKTGIISFGILSKTWDQCAGYPLAIVDNRNQAIQPLFHQVHKSQINPEDNLCDKVSYFDVETFQTNGTVNYPLGYPLYVVYPKDNSRQSAGLIFALMLQTRQGQCLLSKVGLVPLQPMPNEIKTYACKSVPKP
ncbi:putative serine/threonine kinase [Calothrix sp. NIES-4071]|nr:putative serine/threonine kinase [Calothrix sp. NIES-4071]BAZ62823.1 putative serine/threonine kinase [Calothrix sp. NIES-4105]